MHPSFHEELAEMVAALNDQKKKLTGAVEQLSSLRETVTSKNRMVKASVNARGQLSELVFAGNRWRDLSAKELGSLVLEVITRAQDQMYEKAAGMVSGLVMEGVDLPDLLQNPPSVDSFFPDFEKLWRSEP